MMLRLNIYAIALSGILMLFAGLLLYLFQEQLAGGNIRYFLPIPPTAVAAYVFVFNTFKYHDGAMPQTRELLVEIAMASGCTLAVFLFFTLGMIGMIRFVL